MVGLSSLLLLLSNAAAVSLAVPHPHHPRGSGKRASVVALSVPESLAGASIAHSPSFSSLSIEPAFFVEFVGTAAEPNELFLQLLSHVVARGGRPLLRPGGITMDSLVFDPQHAGDLERTMGPGGEVYRTTVGPRYFESWSNLPAEVSFVSTLNFGNDSLQIASDLAVASVKYQSARIQFLELGNEPNNFPEERWGDETAAYVAQWKNWTASIDAAVAAELSSSDACSSDEQPLLRWWASSATTDDTPLKVRPVDLIAAGIDTADQVGQFSLHSYVYNTCTPSNAAKATIGALLNHTQIVTFAAAEVGPSAEASQKHGKPWAMGEFNSIACSGKPGVSDTFAQALWMADTQLHYAARNASSVHQHQGATLVLQSGQQTNTPGFSTYSLLYPRDSEARGPARVNPSFAGWLLLTEVFAAQEGGTRILPLSLSLSEEEEEGLDPDRVSAYAAYNEDDAPTKLVLLNLHPYYANNSTSDFAINVDVSAYVDEARRKGSSSSSASCAPSAPASIKRLTAPSVDEQDASRVSWAGQTFKNGDASGYAVIEQLSGDGIVTVRGSEAVVVFLGDDPVYGL